MDLATWEGNTCFQLERTDTLAFPFGLFRQNARVELPSSVSPGLAGAEAEPKFSEASPLFNVVYTYPFMLFQSSGSHTSRESRTLARF